jgi:TRAP-type mannitol/chloroaromatic compound transport system permease small subunit
MHDERGGAREVKRIVDRLHRVTLGVALVLFAAMFAVQVAMVLMRYVMGVGFVELQDVVTYSFSALVVLSIPLAMRLDRHVRVDVLRAKFAAGRNRRIDRMGHVIFTLPVFGLMLWNAVPLVSASWKIREGSMETGGLAGLFLVKSTVIVMCVLVLILALTDLADRKGARDER